MVPLATDIPFNLDKPMAWKLLNHRSTASRSSSLQRSRISRCRTCRIWESITKLHACRVWRVLPWHFVGLITEGCAKCFCGLGFEHFYPALKLSLLRQPISLESKFCFELVCREAFEVAEVGLLHHLCWCNADLVAVGTIFCENLFDQCLLFGHRAVHRALKNLLNLFLMCKKKPPPKAGVLKVQRECVLVPTT